MGYEVPTAAASPLELRLDQIMDAVEAGAIPAAKLGGRRARRRAAKSRLTQAGAIAAILGVEGCLPITADGPEMTAPDAPPQASPSLDPAPAETAPSAPAMPPMEASAIEIPVAEVLSDIPGAKSIVRVFGSEGGTVELHGSVVHFMPHDGFTGTATFKFDYRDGFGRLRRSDHEFTVGDEAHHDAPAQGGGEDHGEAGGHSLDPHGPHADDASKQSEHLSLLALVPVADATHVAVNSGSWFDPNTWASGEVPGDGAKVVIPEGVSVQYDGESSVSIFTVRVDGELDFATDSDTFLEVDTLIVAPTGHMTIGTVDNPIAANVDAVIQIADNGPIDVGWDPMLLSRGVISHGAIEIHGAEKENFIRVAVDPMKGDTSITLDAPPEGWEVGDKLVLTGTHLKETGIYEQDQPRFADTTEDEELIITAINGNQIVFDRPLQYDHEGARADLKAYVANYSRNVTIQTEGGDATPIHERGHVMFMHSDNVDVRYAAFEDLGRTDKSERAFDFGDLDHITSDSNLKGRYSLHIHRAGVGDLEDPAMIVGNAVWGSPGWGFVHHDSNAVLAGNAAYDVFGAAFVAESGNETGRWVDNISIKTIGVETGSKDGEDHDAFDLGRNGTGFWFQGRLVDAVDNVAAGSPGGNGFVYMHRQPRDEMVSVDPDTVRQGEKLRYSDDELIYEPNINQYQGNEALAVFRGLHVVKPDSQQHHDVRSVLQDFTAWEVIEGVHLEYTGHYTLKNFDLVGTDQDIRRADTSNGLVYGNNAFDMVVNGADIQGFQRGILVFKDTTLETVEDFRYFFIDVSFDGNGTNYLNLARFAGETPEDRFMVGGDLVHRPIAYESAFDDGIASGPQKISDPSLILAGVKTDSIGSAPTSNDFDPFTVSYLDIRGAVEANGYWQTADGRNITLIEEYVADRATGAMNKFSVFVEVPESLSLTPVGGLESVRAPAVFNGLYEPANAAPVAGADNVTVSAGESITIDVLANDFDPEGRDIELDGFWSPSQDGLIVANDDGTITYTPDPGFTGDDVFCYWVGDDQGNFTMQMVTVTVDV